MAAEDRAPIGRRRAALDMAAQLVGQLANLALGVAVMVVLVRALGERGFGQWAAILAVVTIAGYVGSMGFEPAAVKEAAADPGRRPLWIGALVVMRFAGAAPVAAVSVLLLLLLADDGDMRLAAALMALTLPLAALGALRTVFQLRVRNDVPVAVTTVNSVLWTGAVVAIAAAGGGLVAFAAAFVAAATVSNALQAALALRVERIRVRGSRPLWGVLVRRGVPIGIVGLLTIAYGKIDQVLVYELAGERDAGLYGAAYRLLDSLQFVPIAVMTTLFPLIAAAWATDPERVRSIVRQSAELLSLVSLPALAFTVVASEQLLELLFGEAFGAAAPALPALMGAFVLICFGYLVGNLVIVLELQRRTVFYALAALVLNVALNVALVPEYGFEAAAWITLATEVLVLGLAGRLVSRRMGMRLPLGRVPRVAAAAALMGAAVALLEAAGLGVVGLMAAALAVYTALVFLLRAVSREELAVLVRRPAPAP